MKYEESNRYELKQVLVGDVKNEIVAFLNAKGGTIAVGVSDDGTAKPLSEKQKDTSLTVVSNWIDAHVIYPDPKDLLSFDYNEDGVLLINVREGPEKPYYLAAKGPVPSGTYIRVGRSKIRATHEQIRTMMGDCSSVYFEDKESPEQDLAFREAASRFSEEGVPFEASNYRSYGLANQSGRFTNLALLLSDQNPSVSKFGVYRGDGEDSDELVKKKDFGGSILKQLEDLEDFFDVVNPSQISLGKAWERGEEQDYPGSAVREAILNCFCHANYDIPSPIIMKMYDDHLLVTSPGGLFKGLTLEDAMKGVTSNRNPKLVKILDKLDYIENFSHGIPEMIKVYKKFGLAPSFDSDGFMFRVSFPNVNYSEGKILQDTGETEEMGLSPKEKEALGFIQSKGSVTRSDVEAALSIKTTWAKQILRRLVSVKAVTRSGGSVNSRYTAFKK